MTLVSCVSVKLPVSSNVPEKADNISFKAPEAPFQSAKSPSSDEMWISSKTASTISFYTSCSPSEPPLKNIRASAFAGLESMNISKEENITMSEREALKSDIEGKAEGVPVKIQFIVFKKNSCSYHLSYVSLKENFEKEIAHFTKFVRNFRAQ